MTTSPLKSSERTTTRELYGFRDEVSGMTLRFYTPSRRFDHWTTYMNGAQASYQRYRVEQALTLPAATQASTTPVFAITSDDSGRVWAGWYANGPLRSMRDAYAPREFVSEPVSASLVSDWIEAALPEGVIELKGAWVDPTSEHKSALADLTSRAFLHAMRMLDVRYAYCSAAEHAASRWFNSGAEELPGIIPARYPDDRYRTTVLTWDAETAMERATQEQRRLYDAECRTATGTEVPGAR
ncbi:hypothetical protein E1262_19660 [Jiangella aurantiaca]|uniref:GNAT family N-acetyltransferase n=1 Tax=Jiangella aurantiaca TaxID=2530373 RepID=A0A4R5A5P8_9ACTN|nr:hypothetical protein [Jiangella aurantiaca]TDD67313.1 hypothetical protein E1262_19660 [Jiangella aurantiaca]